MWISALGLLLTLSAAAQSGSLISPKAGAKQRVITFPVDPVRVARGGSSEVALPFRVAAGYHINSNTPGSELLLPTELHLDPPTNIIVGNTTYSPGQEKSFSFAPGEKLNVYTADFEVRTLVKALRSTPPGTYRVHGQLKYQACDDRACYPPGTVPVAFDVKVVKPKARARRNPAQSPHVHE